MKLTREQMPRAAALALVGAGISGLACGTMLYLMISVFGGGVFMLTSTVRFVAVAVTGGVALLLSAGSLALAFLATDHRRNPDTRLAWLAFAAAWAVLTASLTLWYLVIMMRGSLEDAQVS